MKNPKPKTPLLTQIARFFGACLLIFGLLVLAVGLPKHALGFLVPGAAVLASTVKAVRAWAAGALAGLFRRPSPTGVGKSGRNQL